MDKFNNDEEKLGKEYFLKNIKDVDAKKTYNINLYRKHQFYKNIFKNTKDMKEAEDKIYTVNGILLSDYRRIVLELMRIIDILNNYEISFKLSSRDLAEIKKIVNALNDTCKNMSNGELNSPTIINKMKKDISYIQIMLGLNSNFFAATQELYKDAYNNMVIDDEENKKVY